MLRLKKKTEYAMIAMRHIGKKPKQQWASVHEIAESYRVPPELLAKVMQALKGAGFLVSVRGFRGGYAFARGARNIAFLDFLDVFGERTALTDCCDGDRSDCGRRSLCEMSEILTALNERLLGELRGLSLAEVLDLGP